MRNNIKVVAIIQARIGSVRLPGKVLMDIEGKPLLWHLLYRLRKSRMINQLLVATSSESKDDPLEEFCQRHKIEVFRGQEADVLDRYYQAAKKYQADAIVRITGDCPLIDPRVTDEVISVYLNNAGHCHGASNIIKRTFPRGLDIEIFSFQALEQIWRDALKPYQREHVTLYMYENPSLFKLLSVEGKGNFADLRWTVDEKADLEFVKQVYKRLYKKNDIFFMEDIIELTKNEPPLKEINKGVEQKSVSG